MDFKSLSKIKFLDQEDLYDVFATTFTYDDTVEMANYIVERDVVMRSDILMDRIYNFEDTQSAGAYYDYTDVILFINNISNPLNIREGDVISYPINPSDLDKFIYSGNTSSDREQILSSLSYVDKSNKVDSSRKKYIENNYILPPTVNDTPKKPVDVSGTKLKIGGI